MIKAKPFARRATPHLPRRERGVVLMIALIVLVALTLAGLSMVRTVDTGSVISGNLAFRQAAVQATDAAVERAFTVITGTYALAPDTSVANTYISSRANLDTDPAGVPTVLNWATAPSVPAGVLPSGYEARYFVERLCIGDGATAISSADLPSKCVTERAADVSGSKKGSSPVFTGILKTNYRVTVRVTGPRNTLSLAQATIAF